jgi:hypothetical protein
MQKQHKKPLQVGFFPLLANLVLQGCAPKQEVGHDSWCDGSRNGVLVGVATTWAKQLLDVLAAVLGVELYAIGVATKADGLKRVVQLPVLLVAVETYKRHEWGAWWWPFGDDLRCTTWTGKELARSLTRGLPAFPWRFRALG